MKKFFSDHILVIVKTLSLVNEIMLKHKMYLKSGLHQNSRIDMKATIEKIKLMLINCFWNSEKKSSFEPLLIWNSLNLKPDTEANGANGSNRRV